MQKVVVNFLKPKCQFHFSLCRCFNIANLPQQNLIYCVSQNKNFRVGENKGQSKVSRQTKHIHLWLNKAFTIPKLITIAQRKVTSDLEFIQQPHSKYKRMTKSY